MAALGIDTSNYTTSAAVFREDGTGANAGKLLTVGEGALGLRQSDALFQHVKALPERFAELREQGMLKEIAAVGASTQPRAVEGSYMPCFLAGASQGQVLADALGVPFYAFSHQQGHVAAACWSAGRMELMDQPMLAWHLSGGTTELLLVVPEGSNVRCGRIGGTTDISAGQLIDRAGQMLHTPFPSGKMLDKYSQYSDRKDFFRVRLDGFEFSLSGMENKVRDMVADHRLPSDIARFTLLTIASAVERTTQAARRKYPGLPVVCSGGVASNSLLREKLNGAVFAKPAYSTDNAMGTAILAMRRLQRGN
ncbi:MAG: DNA-binding protein [Oscillospiraceae bacterium]|nr:DNA-binding protein [Oscillospiraceae bacterium]